MPQPAVAASSSASAQGQAENRRVCRERRRRAFYSLVFGSIKPRRRRGRRRDESVAAIADLHEGRWLAVAMGILLLSVADAFMTLQLMEHGATEANPVMALALQGKVGYEFGVWKMVLTSMGVVLLTLLAPLRAFRRFPVGSLLYGVLGIYAVLVGYEVWLLRVLQA